MRSASEPSDRFAVVLSGLRVLVVEDDPDCRDVFALMLEQGGAVVTPVGLAADAIVALDGGRFDVLVSDIGLPDEDGYSLIRKVRSRSRRHGGKTPAVAVTAFADAESRAKAITAGFHAFVPKPVESAALVGVIAVLARRVEESRRLLEELTMRAGVRRPSLDELRRLFADRERSRAEARRRRVEARGLRGRPAS